MKFISKGSVLAVAAIITAATFSTTANAQSDLRRIERDAGRVERDQGALREDRKNLREDRANLQRDGERRWCTVQAARADNPKPWCDAPQVRVVTARLGSFHGMSMSRN